jgi:hypothetical protein
MADRLFLDVRQFAAPPGRPTGAERFERRPARLSVSRLMREWLDRWRGSEGGAELVAVPDYLPNDWR